MAKKKYVIKCLVAGAGGVGKTTLLHKVTTGEFLTNTQITIGVQFHLLNVEYGDCLFVLQLWDFGGQKRFRFMLDSYVAGAKGAMLLYDTTRYKTLTQIDEWIDIVRKQDKNLPVLFVGTKIDREDAIQVHPEDVQEHLDAHNLFDHCQISSKTATGIEKAFEIFVKELARHHGMEVTENLDHFKMYSK